MRREKFVDVERDPKGVPQHGLGLVVHGVGEARQSEHFVQVEHVQDGSFRRIVSPETKKYRMDQVLEPVVLMIVLLNFFYQLKTNFHMKF